MAILLESTRTPGGIDEPIRARGRPRRDGLGVLGYLNNSSVRVEADLCFGQAATIAGKPHQGLIKGTNGPDVIGAFLT